MAIEDFGVEVIIRVRCIMRDNKKYEKSIKIQYFVKIYKYIYGCCK